MKLKDLTTLPKVRDSYSYLYVEHCRIEQDAKAIAFFDLDGKTSVPCANLSLLMIGPGSAITHSAVKALADNGCLIMWSGEGAVRFYALGLGETRGSRRLLRQAYLSSLPRLRLRVVRRMYEMRFAEELSDELTLQQIRGREGVRVRTAYSQASAQTGVPWLGRSYNKDAWFSADPVNRALSAANSCLYGVCHAAIVSAGYSPALGFIHSGRMLSFVYDIADLYKADISIPLAFEIVKESEDDIERRVRYRLRDAFHESRFLSRIIPDIENALDIRTDDAEVAFDLDDLVPGGLWDGGDNTVPGGVNYGDEQSNHPDTKEEIPQ
ncbi:MAG TPA: type I-E CRISPR-associated endonuclease Cas1e [Pyrinomonadaceae bacterium]|nr:type I-E CRISPR-associated endonuclease Cas1e [Pyrinomonadaceae bacterium]HMP66288.1 type I-E CRISPR-associated endonuclease Cas1e [Pyrinomonadaceae bacterium]